MKCKLLLRRFFASLLLLAVSTLSWAYDFEVNGIYYYRNSNGTSVTVTYKDGNYNSYSGTVVIPTSVEYNDQNYTVTSIGSYAFYRCSGLTSITIPNSVTSIGSQAFYGCSKLPVTDNLRYADTYLVEAVDKTLSTYNIKAGTRFIGSSAFSGCSGLTSITIPNSVTSIGRDAFYGCSGLTSITIPNSVTSIDIYTFLGCSGLTSITIPNSVTSIGSGAFSGCSGLTSITIPESVTSIDQYAFSGCTSLPVIDNIRYADTYLVEVIDKNQNTYNIKSGVRFIGSYAFENCSGLTSITIPNSVTSIDGGAFNGCSGLTSINIPESVTSIGRYAFYNCSSLTSVTIPNSVTSIGDYAFSDCSGLKSITIPNSVTGIGQSVFYNCSSLTSVTIPEGVTSIDVNAFSGCSALTSITIPNSVTSIGVWAFLGCSGLTSVTIGHGVTSVGENAFQGLSKLSSLAILCKNVKNWFKGVTTLKELVLGNEVTSIDNGAFSGCSALNTISIGSGIKSIGAKAFANCRSINDVYCYAIRYPITPADAFENSYPDYITLHVPDESVDYYKAVAPWNTFKNVVGISSGGGSEACEKPVLTYKDGKLEATSETEGAQCVIIISDEDINTHFNSVNLTATYHISAYATKPNYKNSEIVTATLCWIDQEPETEGLINDVAEVRALPVLIQSEGGVISVNGVNSGTEVRVYSVNGTMAGSANATDNSAQIDTNLLPGSIAIVKIGEKSVKIVMK